MHYHLLLFPRFDTHLNNYTQCLTGAQEYADAWVTQECAVMCSAVPSARLHVRLLPLRDAPVMRTGAAASWCFLAQERAAALCRGVSHATSVGRSEVSTALQEEAVVTAL